MRAGRLRQRFTFQRLTSTIDEAGGRIETWGDLFTVWGAYKPLSGNEETTTDRVNATFKGKIIIRMFTDTKAITPYDRVLIDGVPHQILSIYSPDQVNKSLEMDVERGVRT